MTRISLKSRNEPTRRLIELNFVFTLRLTLLQKRSEGSGECILIPRSGSGELTRDFCLGEFLL